MNQKVRILAAIAVATSIGLIACKKSSKGEADYSIQLATQSDDHSRVSSDMEAADVELMDAIESNASFSGRLDGTSGITALCNATATMDSTATVRRLTVVFNGANCLGNRTRTGTVVMSMPLATRWKDAGAVMTATITNLKIVRVADGKSITINGTRVLTNVSGGRLIQLATLQSITHTVTSNNMSVTFDDGTTRQWQVARKRVYTYNNGAVLTITGTHTEGSTTGVAEWGTNRLGNTFVTAITQPLILRQDCDFRITSGQVQHTRLLADATVTFGLNSTGAPTSCPGANPYYFKLEWTGAAGNSHTLIYPY
ncbi:MAG: hypothetical protein JWP27_2522 [Flaviaesturariibacter sp.]|nr:hypothetical protein [Flaviaesturariibacter sp.]